MRANPSSFIVISGGGSQLPAAENCRASVKKPGGAQGPYILYISGVLKARSRFDAVAEF